MRSAPVVIVGSPVDPAQAGPLDAGLLAHVAGLLAGYLAAVMMVLMSRTPVLERRVGSDVLARCHSAGGRAFLGLVLLHAGAALQEWATAIGPTAPSSSCPHRRHGAGAGPTSAVPPHIGGAELVVEACQVGPA